MATKRALSVAKQADEFLSLVDAAGSIPGQRASRFISQLAKDVYDVVFDFIPAGKLSENPSYQGVDPDYLGYSRYAFSHGTISGVYASSPDHVVLLELRIKGKVPAELTELHHRAKVA